MEKIIYLYISVNGQTESDSMSVTESEWNKMSDKEQGELIREFLPNIVDVWTEAKEGKCSEDVK